MNYVLIQKNSYAFLMGLAAEKISIFGCTRLNNANWNSVITLQNLKISFQTDILDKSPIKCSLHYNFITGIHSLKDAKFYLIIGDTNTW